MEIISRELLFDSSNGSDRIFVRIVEPANQSDIKAILQIAHGMAEHSLLYMDFAKFMASKGYVVAVNDHIGHGNSVSTGGAYGYFGKGGTNNLITDMHKLYDLMHSTYPHVPYIMMGHSMGSFLARAYSARFGEDLAAAVYLGTGTTTPTLLKAQIRFAERMVKKFGEKAHKPIFAKLSTVKFNKAFAPNRTTADWLSRDEAQVDYYVNDPLCGFDFTISGYRDILYLQKEIDCKEWYRNVPNIPILIVSGDKDPVGNFGKGVKKVADGLIKTGHNVRLILYPEARHVVLCETNKDESYSDICNFLESVTETQKVKVMA